MNINYLETVFKNAKENGLDVCIVSVRKIKFEEEN